MTFTIERSVEVLNRTPEALRGLLSGISDFWSQNNYGEGTFSPFDVVGHLIHAERTSWMTRLRMILESGESSPFPAFDRYAMYEESRGKTINELLETFATFRNANMAELASLNLTQEKLALYGTHPDLGRVTMRELLSSWVVHDLGHLHQVAKAMAYQYRNDVGAWKEVLTILPRVE